MCDASAVRSIVGSFDSELLYATFRYAYDKRGDVLYFVSIDEIDVPIANRSGCHKFEHELISFHYRKSMQ